MPSRATDSDIWDGQVVVSAMLNTRSGDRAAVSDALSDAGDQQQVTDLPRRSTSATVATASVDPDPTRTAGGTAGSNGDTTAPNRNAGPPFPGYLTATG